MKTMPIFVKHIIRRLVQQHFPRHHTGRPRKYDDVELIDQIFKVLYTGMQWNQLTSDGSYKTINNIFHKWNRRGIFKMAYDKFIRIYTRNRRNSRHKIKKHIIDTTFVKNIYGRDCVGRNPTDRGRKATKMSVITDEYGVTLAVKMFPGNRSDCVTIADTFRELDRNSIQGIQFKQKT